MPLLASLVGSLVQGLETRGLLRLVHPIVIVLLCRTLRTSHGLLAWVASFPFTQPFPFPGRLSAVYKCKLLETLYTYRRMS